VCSSDLRFFDEIDPVLEHVQAAFFGRSFTRQVVDDYFPGLANPIKSADPLLNHHRIPWKVVIDHDVGELEVAPLATGFRRNHDLGRVSELADRPLLLLQVDCSVKTDNSIPSRVEHLMQKPLGLNKASEDKALLGGILLERGINEPCQQGHRLRVSKLAELCDQLIEKLNLPFGCLSIERNLLERIDSFT